MILARLAPGLALLLACATAFASGSAWKGEALRNEIEVSGKPLVLNGMGMREATIFNVKVYIAGLYVERSSTDPQAILGSDEKKDIEMKFVRDVSPSQMNDAWKESYERNCGSDCPTLKLPYQKLESLMVPMSSGDTMSFEFDPKGVTVTLKDSPPVRIEGQAFSRALLATWIGSNPADDDLKSALLKGAEKIAPKASPVLSKSDLK